MEEFVRLYNLRVRARYNDGERVGQAMFNALCDLDPDTAEMIRGNYALDPFHADTGRNYHKCRAFLVEVFGNYADMVRWI